MKEITEVFGCVVDEFREGDVLVHGCNAMGVMGSGVARVIRDKIPSAYSAYRNHFENYGLTTGTVVYARCSGNRVVANAITQHGTTVYGEKVVCYDAIYECFKKIMEEHSDSKRIIFPAIGAGLGGGNWKIISNIIEAVKEEAGYSGELVLITLAQ